MNHAALLRIRIITAACTWPGVAIEVIFRHLIQYSAWWLIPTALGWLLLAVGVSWSTNIILRQPRDVLDARPD